MKKLISVLLCVVLIFSLGTLAFAGRELAPMIKIDEQTGQQSLKFRDDGKFTILQMNDTQDIQTMNKRTEAFIRAAVAEVKPDLVVIPGDVSNDIFIGANTKLVKQCLRNLGSLLSELKVPFAYTPGNHDHDKDDMLSTAEQMAVFEEFAYNIHNFSREEDPGTFNIPILGSDGKSLALNVYMIDSQNKDGLANGYTGCTPETTAWYVEKSNELKELNGGEVVPSVVFQHVPVKEIYQCLQEVDKKQANDAIFSLNDYKWYVEIEDKMYNDETRMIKKDNYIGEAPCSEMPDSVSGEYDAWVQQGDVIGAFFAHDHVNHFMMQSDDGIIMGYNGGTGFTAYGRGSHRSMRVYRFDENDVKNYTIDSVYYDDLTGNSFKFYPSDIMSTAIFGDVLRFLFRLVFITPWKGSR